MISIKKHYLSSLALIICSHSFASSSVPSTGTISFSGQITDATCEVSVNDDGTDSTVVLPTVSTSELVNIGDKTGRTDFNIKLHNCNTGKDGITMVSTFFQSGPTVDSTSGRLLQMTPDGAKNVSLEILDKESDTPIAIGNISQNKNSTFHELNEGNKEITFPYSVRYYSEGDVTPGSVNSSVIYSLQYK